MTAPGPGPRENTYTLVFGTKGTGKSLYSEGVVRAREAAGGSWVWYDGPGSRSHLGPVVSSSLELREAMRDAHQEGRPLGVVVQLEYGAESDELWRPIYRYGSVLLVLDDVQNIADAWRVDPSLRELIVKGRNREIDVITTVQAPPDVHGTLRANRDRVVTFRQVDPHYAEQTAKRFFPALEDAAERIRTLPRWHYLVAEGPAISWGRIPDPTASRP